MGEHPPYKWETADRYRDWVPNMRSLPKTISTQYNLKGKKTKYLSCGCCVLQDLRQQELDKIHKDEMNLGSVDTVSYTSNGK